MGMEPPRYATTRRTGSGRRWLDIHRAKRRLYRYPRRTAEGLHGRPRSLATVAVEGCPVNRHNPRIGLNKGRFGTHWETFRKAGSGFRGYL